MIDEAQGKVVDRIHLETGLPTSVRLSHDRKTIYVTTNDHSGVEVIDVATHKVTNHFVLERCHPLVPVQRRRARPGREAALHYHHRRSPSRPTATISGKPKYTIIDLAQQKISKTVDQPTADAAGGTERAAAAGGGGGGGRGGGGFEVSPDGKYLYQFGSTITVLNAADFSVVERIPVVAARSARNGEPGLRRVAGIDQRAWAARIALQFLRSHRAQPCLRPGEFDLNTRKFDFTPIGPAPDSHGWSARHAR